MAYPYHFLAVMVPKEEEWPGDLRNGPHNVAPRRPGAGRRPTGSLVRPTSPKRATPGARSEPGEGRTGAGHRTRGASDASRYVRAPRREAPPGGAAWDLGAARLPTPGPPLGIRPRPRATGR